MLRSAITRNLAAVAAAALLASACGSDEAAPAATAASTAAAVTTTAAAPADEAGPAEPDPPPATTAPTEAPDDQTAESEQQAESQQQAAGATADTPESDTAPVEAMGTARAQAEIYDLTVAAVELWDNDDIGAACALIDKAQAIIDGHTADPGNDAWQHTVQILADWAHDCQTALAPTPTAPPTTTATAGPSTATTTDPATPAATSTAAPDEAMGTQRAQAEIYDLTVAAVELWDNDDIGAACALIDKAQAIIDGHTADPGDDAWQQTVQILADWAHDCQTALAPTPTPEPEPTTTTTPEPEPTTTTTPEPEPTTTTPEPEPTTTTAPEPEPAVARIAEPVERCVEDYFWAGHLAVLAGTTQGGVYQPVAARSPDSCDRIMTWWDQITQAEAQRIAQGQYPCEYTAAYTIYPRAAQTSGPPILVGCWPRLLSAAQQLVDETGERLYDPEEDAKQRRYLEGQSILPPNHPVFIEALWDCYRDAVQGPLGDWMYIDGCNILLISFGNPVRYLGVTPECAAEQYRGQAAETRARGWVGDEWQYTGDYSWANCATRASRLIPAGMETASFAARCEAVIDASVQPEETDATAARYGLTQAEYIAQTKDMYCAGTLENLRNYPQFHGESVASWLPAHAPNSGTKAVCLEAALLAAAHTGVNDRATKVTRC